MIPMIPMNRRLIVVATALLALCLFAAAGFFYKRDDAAPPVLAVSGGTFVRSHSPVIGPETAPVTIVEFFDPACEACREMYPYVKQILDAYPTQARLVVRYAPLHAGSDVAVRILEAARAQGKFETMLEVLLARQPEWASHHAPNLEAAWELAALAGLDLERARREAFTPAVDAVLAQDLDDVRTHAVRKTPTFFVNGKPLPSFGPQQLYDLVSEEVRLQPAAADRPQSVPRE
jgi:protein-disulfide isomerase